MIKESMKTNDPAPGMIPSKLPPDEPPEKSIENSVYIEEIDVIKIDSKQTIMA